MTSLASPFIQNFLCFVLKFLSNSILILLSEDEGVISTVCLLPEVLKITLYIHSQRGSWYLNFRYHEREANSNNDFSKMYLYTRCIELILNWNWKTAVFDKPDFTFSPKMLLLFPAGLNKYEKPNICWQSPKGVTSTLGCIEGRGKKA